MPTAQEVQDEIIDWFREVYLRKVSPSRPLSFYKWLGLVDVLQLVDTLRHTFRFTYPDRDVNVLLLHGMTANEIAAFVLPLIRQARDSDPRPCEPGAHKPVNPTNRRPWQEQALREETCQYCGRKIKRMRSGWYLVNKEPSTYVPPPAIAPRTAVLPLKLGKLNSDERKQPEAYDWSLILVFLLFLLVAIIIALTSYYSRT